MKQTASLCFSVPTPILPESGFHHPVITDASHSRCLSIHTQQLLGPGGLGRQTDRWALDLGKHEVTLGAAPCSKVGRGMILDLFEVTPTPNSAWSSQPGLTHPGSRGQKPLAVLYARKEMGWRAEEF